MNKHWGWMKPKVHPLCFIYYILALMSGYFKWYIIAMSLVLIHEYGHALVAQYFHFKIQRILLLPFGAFLEIEDYGQYPIYQEFCMLLGGLVTHIFIFFFLKYGFSLGLSAIAKDYALRMNQLIFLFNLLPIWPMDGSKLLELILFYLFEYRKAVWINLSVSFVVFIVVFIVHFRLDRLMIAVYLGYRFLQAWKEKRYRYIRYLLHEDHFKKKRRFHQKLLFYRPYDNILVKDGRWIEANGIKKVSIKETF